MSLSKTISLFLDLAVLRCITFLSVGCELTLNIKNSDSINLRLYFDRKLIMYL